MVRRKHRRNYSESPQKRKKKGLKTPPVIISLVCKRLKRKRKKKKKLTNGQDGLYMSVGFPKGRRKGNFKFLNRKCTTWKEYVVGSFPPPPVSVKPVF